MSTQPTIETPAGIGPATAENAPVATSAPATDHLVGLYLYGIVRADATPQLPDAGIDDQPIELIQRGGAAYVCSRIEPRKLRPTRKHLAAHHAVLRSLEPLDAVLPMAFGNIADTQDDLDELLDDHHGDFAEALDRVAGCIEMVVTLAWDVAEIIPMLVEQHDELRAARDQLLRRGGHDAQMEVGRLVERTIRIEQDHAHDLLNEALEPVSIELARADPKNERELVRLACLIRRDDRDAFESALERVALAFDARHVFTLAGPFLCQSFIDSSLTLSS